MHRESSAALPPGGYRTKSLPFPHAERSGSSSAGKRPRPIDAYAVELHPPPECGYEERALADLPATVDGTPVQPPARRARPAIARVAGSEEQGFRSRGPMKNWARILTRQGKCPISSRASIETARSSFETLVSSTHRAAASAVPQKGLQSPRVPYIPPSACTERIREHRTLPRRRTGDG